MKEEKKIEFTQKWIGDAVKKFLQKEDIYESDMERIRYMCIGDCNFGGLYTIELSTAAPPDPFYTTAVGEKWEPDGETVVAGRFLRLYIDYAKEKPWHYKKSDTGERFFQLLPYTVWKEFKEQYEGAYEEEYDEEDFETGWMSLHNRNAYEKANLRNADKLHDLIATLDEINDENKVLDTCFLYKEYIPDENDLGLFYENPLAYEWEFGIWNFY